MEQVGTDSKKMTEKRHATSLQDACQSILIEILPEQDEPKTIGTWAELRDKFKDLDVFYRRMHYLITQKRVLITVKKI